MRKRLPADLFVFDDQLHMIRETMDGPLALRALSQGEGEAAKAAGFDKNPFNAEGLPDEFGRAWSAWNPALGQSPITGANFQAGEVREGRVSRQPGVGGDPVQRAARPVRAARRRQAAHPAPASTSRSPR